MLDLFRRHLILTVVCLTCVILVLIAWSLRLVEELSPIARNASAPLETAPAEPAVETPQTAPVLEVAPADDCEIPNDWLTPAGNWLSLVTEERADRILEFAEAAFFESRNVDELVFATTLADQSGAALARFDEEIRNGARSPYLLFKAVDRCYAKNGSGASCPREQWLELLTRLDSENSEVWIRVAGLRFQQGDDAAGMLALQRAATASGSNDYYARDLQAFLSGFEASGETTRFEAARIAIELANSDLPAIEYHLYACADPDIADQRRLQLCDEYKTNVRARPISRTLRDVSDRIEMSLAKTRGDEDQVERLESAANARVSDPADERARTLYERLNPDLLFDYINDIALLGQQNAERNRLERLENAGFGEFLERCSDALAIDE